MSEGRLFFRVIECADGTWACRHGRQEYDRHVTFDDALEHTTKIAAAHQPAQIFVHHLDGRVHSAAVLDGTDPPL